MNNRNKSILVALNDSRSSRALIDYLINLAICPEDWNISLIHFYRKASASEELMGRKFTKDQPSRIMSLLKKTKDKLVEKGFNPSKIETELVDEQYETIADGIIDQVKKRHFDLIVIGRKKMSKAEEFVMGDISIKLVRSLEDTAILVVKSK